MAENNEDYIEQQRAWLLAHKESSGFSWTTLYARVGISSALSQFATGNYAGDRAKIANQIESYRRLLEQQAEIDYQAPTIPAYFETPSARRIMTMLSMAQRGRITVIASGPGTSKTSTIRQYALQAANVWVVTISPSCSEMHPMLKEVLEALGDPTAKGGQHDLSRRIRTRVRGTGGLIVFDEAQHLKESALEEIRSWHDATGIGICLAGNEEVLLRLEHGARKTAFARLASRVNQRLIFSAASEEDAAALADAWEVHGAKARTFLALIAGKPGALRNATMVLETASMIAAADKVALDVRHMEDAWAMLTTRRLAA